MNQNLDDNFKIFQRYYPCFSSEIKLIVKDRRRRKIPQSNNDALWLMYLFFLFFLESIYVSVILILLHRTQFYSRFNTFLKF